MEKSNNNGKLQRSIGSGFTAESTAREVMTGIDLTGKIAVVTGGNTGIGLETVKTLAYAGATVIVGARDCEKAATNLQGIPNVYLEKLDLADPISIDIFANNIVASGKPLHYLINNAGIMWVPFRKDVRGIESQLAVNYLAQYQLTARLWPSLKKAQGARVINVSSGGHHFAAFNFEDPHFEQRAYDSLQGYGQSKTAVNLFTLELDNRAQKYGVRAYSLNPGSIAGTELAREAPVALFIEMGFYNEEGEMRPEVAASLKSIPQGAATTVWCTTSSMLNDIGGVYCEDSEVARLCSEEGSTSGVNPYALDSKDAKKLWELSEKLTGVTFQFD